MIEVRTAGKLGYCSGVSRAIEQAMKYGDRNGKVYSLGTVAHNEDVVELLRQHGVEPISVEGMKAGTCVVITAHGAPPELYDKIRKLGCTSLDCTCPIVKKAQDVAADLAEAKFDIVIFGDPDHQEVKGLVGWAQGRAKFIGGFYDLFTPSQEIKALGMGKWVGVVSQTTKVPAEYADFCTTLLHHHIDELQEVRIRNTICPIVSQRIEATRELAKQVDLFLVVGSRESANTKNLAHVASVQMGQRFPSVNSADVVTIPDEVPVGLLLARWAINHERAPKIVGVTAGTSTPIEVVERVIRRVEECTHMPKG